MTILQSKSSTHWNIKLSLLSIALLLGTQSSFADSPGETTTAPQEKVKIGIAVPLSGGAASYGTDIKNALLFANKRIANNAYEFVIEDDHCNDKDAVNIAQKMVNIDKVQFMLGFGCSGTVLASAPVYERAKVVVIASGTGAPKITDAGDYIFRTKPSLDVAGQKLFRDMAAKYRKVGLITEETAYCQGLTDAVIQSKKNEDIEIYNENYLPQTDDFRSMLTKLKAKGVEALFLNTQGEDTLITIFKQLMVLNWDVQLYGTFHPGSLSFLEEFGEKADGIIYADTPFNHQMLNKQGLKVYAEFEQEYGKARASEHFVTLSYASFSALHDALTSLGANATGEDVKEFLYSTQFTNIIDGYSFDENGDVVSDQVTYLLKVIRNGKPAEYQSS